MRLAKRLLLIVALAGGRTWEKSAVRRAVRALVLRRTASMLRQLDSDTRELLLLRDVQIPHTLRVAASEKHRLLLQWSALADGAPAPGIYSYPATVSPSRAAAVFPRSRYQHAQHGRLYTQRTSK